MYIYIYTHIYIYLYIYIHIIYVIQLLSGGALLGIPTAKDGGSNSVHSGDQLGEDHSKRHNLGLGCIVFIVYCSIIV